MSCFRLVLCSLVLVGSCLAAGPAGAGGGERLHVRGDVELTAEAAEASALATARQLCRDRITRAVRIHVRDEAPDWLPGFAVERAISDYLEQQIQHRKLRVVDAKTSARDYSYGTAYTTEMLVEAPTALDAGALTRSLRRAGKLVVAQGAGLALLWSAVALVAAWLDRLTRGYMTWRLRAIAMVVAGAASAPVLLL